MFHSLLYLKAIPLHTKWKGNGAGCRETRRPAGPGSSLCQLWFCQPEAPVFSSSLGYTLHLLPVEGKVARRNRWERIQYLTFPTVKLIIQVIPNKFFLRTEISRQSLSCFYQQHQPLGTMTFSCLN